jgi:molybdopterin-guanine dinucleotide biosynthesis protein A
VLREELMAGRGGCFAAFRAAATRLAQPVDVVPAEILVQTGQVEDERGLPPLRWFLNVNVPDDLERARLAIA